MGKDKYKNGSYVPEYSEIYNTLSPSESAAAHERYYKREKEEREGKKRKTVFKSGEYKMNSQKQDSTYEENVNKYLEEFYKEEDKKKKMEEIIKKAKEQIVENKNKGKEESMEEIIEKIMRKEKNQRKVDGMISGKDEL